MVAFERSLFLDFGIEVDIRDYKGDLVISHDLPSENSPKLALLLEIYSKNIHKPFIAMKGLCMFLLYISNNKASFGLFSLGKSCDMTKSPL